MPCSNMLMLQQNMHQNYQASQRLNSSRFWVVASLNQNTRHTKMKCSRRVSDFTKRVGALKGAFGEIQEGLKEGFKEASRGLQRTLKEALGGL